MMRHLCLLFAVIAGIVVADEPPSDPCAEFYQPNNIPQITPCKKEVILQNGQNYTLKCRANTPVEFIQQDIAEEKFGDFKIINGSSVDVDENAKYTYEASIELQNVDQYAIGYYACIRKNSSVDRKVINELADEPNNSENISYIYIYVDGTDNLFAPVSEFVTAKKNFYVVECKPTTPDVEVKILSQNKTPKLNIARNNIIKFTPKIGFVLKECLKVAYTCLANKNGSDPENKTIPWQTDPPTVSVVGTYNEFIKGETFTLNCSVNYTNDFPVDLYWDLPPTIKNTSTVMYESNKHNATKGVYHSITIVNATKEHEGDYTCKPSKDMCNKTGKSFKKIYLEKPELKIRRGKVVNGERIKEENKQGRILKIFRIESYPPANISLYRNGVLLKNDTKYMKVIHHGETSTYTHGHIEVKLNIILKDVEDSGNYTIVAENTWQGERLAENYTIEKIFISGPKILTTLNTNSTTKFCELNKTVSLQCIVTGYPLPSVHWTTDEGVMQVRGKIDEMSNFKEKAILEVPCLSNINISCVAENDISEENEGKPNINKDVHKFYLLVDEMTSGFGIKTTNADDTFLWYSEKENVTVECVASLHRFRNVTWQLNGVELNSMVETTTNNFSHVAYLKINNITRNHQDNYVCRGIRNDGTAAEQKMFIQVDPFLQPKINLTTNVNDYVQEFQRVHMSCRAFGVPRPTIKWLKDNQELKLNESNIIINTYIEDKKTVYSTILIDRMNTNNTGKYECEADNRQGKAIQEKLLKIKEEAWVPYVIAISVIFIVLIAVVVFLVIKLRRDKAKRERLRQELAAAGLLYFKEGQSKYLNPELGIDEQADLLPYDDRFEFPPENLILGKQLGAGAFGVVYKAEARGIINAEETTPVAVKKVKATADNMYIKALATELKIMVHLGKHVNIVNLLGACTKDVCKRQLSVIVEYCKFGNIHNYMQRHREVFIDQFSDNSALDKQTGKVNRGYDSSGSVGVHSDYGSANTQDTDHTFLTNNTNRTSRKNVRSQPPEVAKASEGYVQHEWRSNYESDYSYDGRSMRPLTSRDLLAWAFQIARGMEYLASRKILHGDLAARNILLAEDNVVKICDFGLARSIYKNDEYQKKENSPLPVKWLAIECMTDRIFSTQSDVWSFGIVLWELFTLAKTPYPNMDPHHLLPFLREGRRLEKPVYSDDRIYEVMRCCWEEKPTMRPSFTQLQEKLGTFLEDNVRNHYVDLNNAYLDLNKIPDGQEDYLAMVSAPDYNNMVTPSPHHYVNEINDSRRFFPPSPATKVDEEGYLQMTPRNNSIFSPKPTSMKFDFDPRKLNSRSSEASSVGSELTPMLNVNNLARSGSDSDQEGSVFPSHNGCPTINEETLDEVFLSKDNNLTSNENAKNALNTAVTNPTYITFDLDVEKKPKNLNEYVNIKPNGLVK